MADLGYSFLDNNFFTTYKSVETPKVEVNIPLMDSPLDISDWAVGITDNGIPIVKDNTPESYMIVNNNPLEDILEVFENNSPSNSTNIMLETLVTGSTRNNAEIVISSLMRDLGLTRAQAAGIAGVMTAESGINPGIFNKGEKNGTYKTSSANNLGKSYGHKNSPWSYGAGICLWTFTDRKEKAIMGGLGVDSNTAKNIITHGGIESLSLNLQIKMLEYELNNSYKSTLEGIRKCDTASEAAATFYCHSIAGFSNSKEKATLTEIDAMNKKYSKVGTKSLINKGMNFAEKYMQ